MKYSMLICLVFAGAAHAQLNKCVTPAGKVEYRGSPCDDARQAKGLSGGTVSGVDAMPRSEIERLSREPATERARPAAAAGKRIPTEQDIKNMETSASSITKRSRLQQAQAQAEIDAAKDLRAGGSGVVDLSAVRAEEARIAQRRAAAVQRPNPGAIDTRTGDFLPGVAGGGVINPRTGQVYQDVGGGYINPQNGQFMPKQ